MLKQILQLEYLRPNARCCIVQDPVAQCLLRGLCIKYQMALTVVDCRHSVNNKPVKRLPSVARLPLAFYIVPHAGWNYGIVTPFLQLKIGT